MNRVPQLAHTVRPAPRAVQNEPRATTGPHGAPHRAPTGPHGGAERTGNRPSLIISGHPGTLARRPAAHHRQKGLLLCDVAAELRHIGAGTGGCAPRARLRWTGR
jgi:hypothetical protein